MRGVRYTKKMVLYGLYKGDSFIDVGTASELAERHHTTNKHIQWLSTPTIHKRAEGSDNWLLAYKVGVILYERETCRSSWVEVEMI